VPELDPSAALLALMGGPNHCSRAWVWEQYDQTVGGDTVVRPGSDAAVVRVHGTAKALAFTADVTPRYCAANPRRGGMQAVAEAFRNLCATGARPLAVTDNLNFGSPERPEIMGQFAGCIEGIAEACRALDMPVVSGNVSFYNETEGRAILPTPTIVAVGLLEDLGQLIRMAPREGDAAVLIGRTAGHLGQSALMAEIYGVEAGDAPPVDLAAERRAGELVRRLHARGLIAAAHDLSDGGLALAAAEMALAGGVGVEIRDSDRLMQAEWFFGEDQGRYLLAVEPGRLQDAMDAVLAADVPCEHVGHFGGALVTLAGSGVPLAELAAAHAGALPAFAD
jgi:phosphoribosylformylglycinamidine synthase